MNEIENKGFAERADELEGQDQMNRDGAWSRARQIVAQNKPTLDAYRIACFSLFELIANSKDQPFERKPPIGLRFRIGYNSLALTAPGFDYGNKIVLCNSQTAELLVEKKKYKNGREFFKPEKRLVLYLSEANTSIRKFYLRTLEQDAELFFNGIKRFLDSPNQMLENSDRCAICRRSLEDGLSKARGVGPECIEKIDKWGLYFGNSVINSAVPLPRELPHQRSTEQ
jgi:hypothetical protein